MELIAAAGLQVCRLLHCGRLDQRCCCCDPNPFWVLMKSPFGSLLFSWGLIKQGLHGGIEEHLSSVLKWDEAAVAMHQMRRSQQPLAAACRRISAEITWKPANKKQFIPSGRDGLNSVRNKRRIWFKFHIKLWHYYSNYHKNTDGSHDAHSASRLNISVATSAVIDSWEINSVAS